MRKIPILLAVAIIAAQSVGCGCCNRMRDWLCRGAYCGAPAQTYVAPAPCAVPAPMMMGAPMAATCPTCPQGYPMETSFEPSCGYGAGMPMYTEGGWAPSGTTGGGVIMTDPGPGPGQ
ncbi:MAG: hypothetical protein WD851_01275 [Pirellulales bacterium]